MIVTMELAEAYLERLKARRDPSEHTIRAYRSDLKNYAAFTQAKAALESFPQDGMDEASPILAYVRYLTTDRRMAIRTTRRRLACLRGFFSDLVRTKAISSSPFQNLDIGLPRAKSLPRCLTRDDAARLARSAKLACSSATGETRELAIAILLLLSVGLRVGELVQLRPSDFDLDGGLHIRGKGRRERRVPVVEPDLRLRLASLLQPVAPTLFNAAGGGWTTQVFRQRLRLFAKAAGVTRRVTPHMLRHTCATLLLEDGVDLLFLQRLLGHENIATTALYAHVGDASLKRALERACLLTSLAA